MPLTSSEPVQPPKSEIPIYNVLAPETGIFYFGSNKFFSRMNERKGRVFARVKGGQILGYIYVDGKRKGIEVKASYQV